MSHFTVNVLITNDNIEKHGSLDEALSVALAPYQENNMGDCPREFLRFNDLEDQYKQEYENNSRDMILLADGTRHCKYDSRFKSMGSPFAISSADRYTYPEDSQQVKVPFKELYPSIEEFARAWHSSTRDPETNKFGYWENPDAKWDWYAIGGRWRGFFPVKASAVPVVGVPGAFDNEARDGRGDIVRLRDIDFDKIAVEHRERIETFWVEWEQYKAGTYEEKPFYGPRSTAMDLGLLRIEEDPNAEITGDVIVTPFVRGTAYEGHPGKHTWRDVYSKIEKEEFLSKYSLFFYPLRTFAAIDAEGKWHSPGKMGWGATVSDDSETSYRDYSEWYVKFMKSAGTEDFYVLVDCHI